MTQQEIIKKLEIFRREYNWLESIRDSNFLREDEMNIKMAFVNREINELNSLLQIPPTKQEETDL